MRCPSCGGEASYRIFSGGREGYCAPCDNQFSLRDEDVPAGSPLALLREGRYEDLREAMRRELRGMTERGHAKP